MSKPGDFDTGDAIAISNDGEPKKDGTRPVVTQLQLESRFSGPLPSPAILAGFEKVTPGAGDRIIRMAEDDGRHRREMEKLMLGAEASLLLRGQAIGFLLIVMLMGGSVALFAMGMPIYALMMFVSALGGMIKAHLSRERDRRERAEEEDREERRSQERRERDLPGSKQPRLPDGKDAAAPEGKLPEAKVHKKRR